MLKSFKDLRVTLESLPTSYLEELSYLTDHYEFDSREEIIERLYSELSNLAKLKNYYLLLDKTQKLAISETVHNLNGKYNEDYFLGKYGEKPVFTRERKVFMQKESPTYINLFIYSKSFIPKELLYLLKKIVVAPPVWQIKTLQYEEIKDKVGTFYTKEFIRDLWYLVQFEDIILTNKNKISKKSNDLISSIYKKQNIDKLLELFISSNLVVIKGNKLKSNHEYCSYNFFIDTLLKAFFIKDANISEEYTQYKKIVLKSLANLVDAEWISIQTFYSFLEIEHFSTYQKNSLLKNRKMKIDFLNNIFRKYLYYLELVEITRTKDNIFFKISDKGKFFLKNSIVSLDRKEKIKIMPNFEILILAKLDQIESLYIGSFTEIISNNIIKITKKKLLKSISQGVLIDDLVLFLRNMSNDTIPESIVLFFKEVKKKILYIEDGVLLNADSFLMNILTHDKKVNKFFTITTENVTINVSNRKITSILASLDYPVIIK